MADQRPKRLRRTAPYVVLICIVGIPLLALGAWWFLIRSAITETSAPITKNASSEDTSIPITFDGSSDELKRTVITPTLDLAVPQGKNAIWCSSFQLAWNKLKTNIAGGAIHLEGAERIAKSLNAAPQSEADLAVGSFYTAAGRNTDGIVDIIRADMGRLFPGVPVSELARDPEGITAYSYLQAFIKFEIPFVEEIKGFQFSDGANVSGFGLPGGRVDRVRAQVEVLFRSSATEYALDLCKSSKPNQFVIARMSPGQTLGETLANIQSKIASSPGSDLGDDDSLRVPNMHWRIAHCFSELEGPDKVCLNSSLRGFYISRAQQIIEFKLDRSGAKLASEAGLEWMDGGREYYLDGPFLLFLKKRDARHPFFVTWIDNDELLQKRR